MATSTASEHGLFDRIVHWCRNWQTRYAAIAQVANLGPDERARIAQDTNLSVSDLQVLAGKWPSAADLLPHRMAALHLDPTEMNQAEPGVLRDLQRTCSMCEDRKRCGIDLEQDAADPVWTEYCPNVQTFDAIATEQMERRIAPK